MLNCVKIKCSSKGCDFKDSPSKIDSNEKFCQFNPYGLRQCKNCKLYFEEDKLKEHDCLSELSTNIEEMKNELEKMAKTHTSDKTKEIIVKLKHSLK